MFTVEYR
jgi:ESCRT-II complex subunit VPS25